LKLRGALESAIVKEKPNVKWDDVAGLMQVEKENEMKRETRETRD
jgi:SpoVK/Ycf46/Vps4 family AAA+-type ATPase